MTVEELRDELDLLIFQGKKDAKVVFDVEGGAFNYHIACISDTIGSVDKEIMGMEYDMVVLHTNDPIIHAWQRN